MIREFTFDTVADLGGDYLANFGTTAGTHGSPVIDTVVRCDGHGSLRFSKPGRTGSDASGSWFANFSPDLSVLPKAGDEFFVQYRYRMNRSMFETEFITVGGKPQGGFKISDLTAGDTPEGQHYYSSSSGKLVLQTYYQHRFPIIYRYKNWVTNNLFDSLPPYDFNLQPRSAGVCHFTGMPAGTVVPAGCTGLVPDEWMTHQLGVKLGALAADGYWDDCNVRLWLARENQPSVLAIDWHGRLWAKDGQFGKVVLMPYLTAQSPTQDHPLCQVWYANLKISTEQLNDPSQEIDMADLTTIQVKALDTLNEARIAATLAAVTQSDIDNAAQLPVVTAERDALQLKITTHNASVDAAKAANTAGNVAEESEEAARLESLRIV